MTFSWRQLALAATGACVVSTASALGFIYYTLGAPNAAAVLAESAQPTPNEVAGFPTQLESQQGVAATPMKLTGTALRTVASYSFYRVGSYCPHDAAIHSPEHMRDLEAPKLLVLRMLMNIPDSLFSSSFRRSLRNNDPKNQFAAETKAMIDYVTSQTIREGDEFRLAYIPGECVTCTYGESAPLVIKNAAFGRVIWSIYFGEYHLGDEIKNGLVALAGAKPSAAPVMARAPAPVPSEHIPGAATSSPLIDEPALIDEPSAAATQPSLVDEPPLVDEPGAAAPATASLVDEPPTP